MFFIQSKQQNKIQNGATFGATPNSKMPLVQHWCNTKNTTKHNKISQNKNSGKPLFLRLSAIYAE